MRNITDKNITVKEQILDFNNYVLERLQIIVNEQSKAKRQIIAIDILQKMKEVKI